MSTKYRSFVHQINLLIRFVWILYTAILKIRTEPAVRESAKCDPIILRLSVYPGIMAYGWKDILTFEWRWLGCTWWRLVMPKSCWISIFFVICEHRQCLDRFRTLPLNYTTDRWVDSKSGDVYPIQGFCRFASSSRGILRSDSGRMKKEITRAEHQLCHGSTFRIARSDIALTIGKTTECPDVPRCNHKSLCVMFDTSVPKLTRMRWIQLIADMPTLVQILCLL